MSALRSPTTAISMSSCHVQVVFITNWPAPVSTCRARSQEPPRARNSLSVPKARQIAVGDVVWQGGPVRPGGDDLLLGELGAHIAGATLALQCHGCTASKSVGALQASNAEEGLGVRSMIKHELRRAKTQVLQRRRQVDQPPKVQ